MIEVVKTETRYCDACKLIIRDDAQHVRLTINNKTIDICDICYRLSTFNSILEKLISHGFGNTLNIYVKEINYDTAGIDSSANAS